MQNNIEQVKSRLDIVEVIRDYIQVKPAGANFKANCPFHNEKTASLVISPAKQIWHCFGCGKGGDVIKFVMEKEALDFGEALRQLARRAGVILEHQDPKLMSARDRLYDIMSVARDRYCFQLGDLNEAQVARDYLAGRGLTEEVIEDWQIGYSSTAWDSLTKYLLSKGWKDSDLLTAGLAVKSSTGNRIYDRFRGRVMFPLNDYNGRTIGFTARILPGREEEDKMGKYINSPETPIYHKGKILFGLDKAKAHIREMDQAIIVEGQLDVITAYQYGFKNVIASSGTALTEDQAVLLERITDNIIFALDGDSAGQTATERAGEVFERMDIKMVTGTDRYGKSKSYVDPAKSFKKNIKVAVLPVGKDPDECIRKDRAGWVRAINEAKLINHFYFDRVLESLDLSKLENKKKIAAKLLSHIAKMSNPLDRSHWLKYLAGKLEIDDKYLTEALAGFKTVQAQSKNQSVEPRPLAREQSREEILSEQLLALVLHFNSEIKYLLDYIKPEELAGSLNQSLYKSLLIYYNQIGSSQDLNLDAFVLDYHNFRQWLDDNKMIGADHLDQLIIMAEKDYYQLDGMQASSQIKIIIKNLKRAYLKERLKAVTRLITELETSQEPDNEQLVSLLAEFNHLSRELSQFLD